MHNVEFNGKPVRSKAEIRCVLKKIQQHVEPLEAGPLAEHLLAIHRRIVRNEVDQSLAGNENESSFVVDAPCDDVDKHIDEGRRVLYHAVIVGGFAGLALGTTLAVAMMCMNLTVFLPITIPALVPGITVICMGLAVQRVKMLTSNSNQL